MKEEKKIIRVGELDIKGWHILAKEVIFEGGVCTAITTQSNNLLQKVLVNEKDEKTD